MLITSYEIKCHINKSHFHFQRMYTFIVYLNVRYMWYIRCVRTNEEHAFGLKNGAFLNYNFKMHNKPTVFELNSWCFPRENIHRNTQNILRSTGEQQSGNESAIRIKGLLYF